MKEKSEPEALALLGEDDFKNINNNQWITEAENSTTIKIHQV